MDIYVETHASGHAVLYQVEGQNKNAVVLGGVRQLDEIMMARKLERELVRSFPDATYRITNLQEELPESEIKPQEGRDAQLYAVLEELGVDVRMRPGYERPALHLGLADRVGTDSRIDSDTASWVS